MTPQQLQNAFVDLFQTVPSRKQASVFHRVPHKQETLEMHYKNVQRKEEVVYSPVTDAQRRSMVAVVVNNDEEGVFLASSWAW